MKKVFLYFIIALSSFADTIEFFHENDLFITDEYYTSGLEFKYRKENKSEMNNFDNFYFGEKFYTPSNILMENPEDYDRPYAAWLYFGYEKEKIENHKELKQGFDLGITGKNALGGFLQSTLHGIIGEEYPKGWDSQIEQMTGIQYNYSLKTEDYSKESNGNYFSRQNHYNVEIGNVFTNFSYGKIFLIGNKTPFEDNQKVLKYYFYLEPQLEIVIYDATLKGSILNNHSPVTKEFNPILLKNSLGTVVQYKNLVLNYTMNFMSNDIKGTPWKLSNHIYSKFFIQYKI